MDRSDSHRFRGFRGATGSRDRRLSAGAASHAADLCTGREGRPASAPPGVVRRQVRGRCPAPATPSELSVAGRRLVPKTWNPACLRAFAVTCPMPVDAPVTRATAELSLFIDMITLLHSVSVEFWAAAIGSRPCHKLKWKPRSFLLNPKAPHVVAIAMSFPPSVGEPGTTRHRAPARTAASESSPPEGPPSS